MVPDCGAFIADMRPYILVTGRTGITWLLTLGLERAPQTSTPNGHTRLSGVAGASSRTEFTPIPRSGVTGNDAGCFHCVN